MNVEQKPRCKDCIHIRLCSEDIYGYCNMKNCYVYKLSVACFEFDDIVVF